MLVVPAQGTPTSVSARARALPIPINLKDPGGPSYPGTGDILGAGVAFEGEVTIAGTEYGGFPPPVTGVRVIAPAGTVLDQRGFAICPQAVLVSHEVSHCPVRSQVSSIGSVRGVVSFGGERVHEGLTVQAFFAASGKIAFYAEGTSPAEIEILETGTVSVGGGGVGPAFVTKVPLVETVPEAPYGVAETLRLEVGPAYRQGKRVVPYIRLPTKCPKGGFTFQLQLTFLIGPPVITHSSLPCPRR